MPSLAPMTTAATAVAAATAASATTATAATPAAKPTTATAATAAGLRPGFIHGNGATIQLLAVEGGNRRLRFRIAAHLDEAEALGAPRITVDNDLRRLHRAMCAELLFQHAVVDVVAEVAYVEFFSQLQISHQD